MNDWDVETMLEHLKLRDKFAKAAITGILAGKWGQMPQYKPEEAFAEFAFRIADAMMVAMVKRRDQDESAQ